MRLHVFVFGILILACLESVSRAAPDPDLFDGRFSVASDALESTGEGTGKAESERTGNNETAADSGSVSSGAKATETGQTDGKAASTSSPVESVRKFDQFGVGATDEVPLLSETNTSKKPLEPVKGRTQTSQTQQPDVYDSTQKESANPEPQEQSNEESRADYGTAVPSGL